MLTKKHFKAIAHELSLFEDNHEFSKKQIVNMFVTLFKESNPRFDIEKFKYACKYVPKHKK